MRSEIDRLADALEKLLHQHRSERLLTWKKVASRLAMSSQAAWRCRRADDRFPKPVRPKGARERWLESEVVAFMHALAADRERSAA